MQPEERDAAYLWDMLNAAREAHMTVEGTACDTFMEVSGEENAAFIPIFRYQTWGYKPSIRMLASLVVHC